MKKILLVLLLVLSVVLVGCGRNQEEEQSIINESKCGYNGVWVSQTPIHADETD